MKIVHLSTSDTGGAFKAAYRLHLGLLEQGMDSKMVVLYQWRKDLIHVYPFLINRTFIQKLKDTLVARLYTFLRKYLILDKPKVQYSFPFSAYNVLENPIVLQAEIIHLHWVANFLDFSSFFKKNRKPIFWTLHDLNPFSGGFHYKMYEKNAYNNLEKWIISIKTKALKNASLNIISPSKWLAEISKSSIFKHFEHYIIPYGISDLYCPIEKNKAKARLGLPLDKKVILFLADFLEDERKGGDLFRKALKELSLTNCVLVTVGEGDLFEITIPHISLGFIQKEEKLVEIYSAADMYVITSLEDNFPNTILESLACGTPVIGFSIGGLPEVIQDGENGFLVEVNDTAALGRRIQEIVEDETLLSTMSQKASKCSENFTLSKQAKQYISLYKNVCSNEST